MCKVNSSTVADFTGYIEFAIVPDSYRALTNPYRFKSQFQKYRDQTSSFIMWAYDIHQYAGQQQSIEQISQPIAKVVPGQRRLILVTGMVPSLVNKTILNTGNTNRSLDNYICDDLPLATGVVEYASDTGGNGKDIGPIWQGSPLIFRGQTSTESTNSKHQYCKACEDKDTELICV